MTYAITAVVYEFALCRVLLCESHACKSHKMTFRESVFSFHCHMRYQGQKEAVELAQLVNLPSKPSHLPRTNIFNTF